MPKVTRLRTLAEAVLLSESWPNKGMWCTREALRESIELESRAGVEIRRGRRDRACQRGRDVRRLYSCHLGESRQRHPHRRWQRDARKPIARRGRSFRSRVQRQLPGRETIVDETRHEVRSECDLARTPERRTTSERSQGAKAEDRRRQPVGRGSRRQ